MVKLEGVIAGEKESPESLKKYALFFDKLHIHGDNPSSDLEAKANFSYLAEQGFIRKTDGRDDANMVKYHGIVRNRPQIRANIAFIEKIAAERKMHSTDLEESEDFLSRIYANTMGLEHKESEVVPICRTSIPPSFLEGEDQRKIVLQVAAQQFPVPGPESDWQGILEFKDEMRDKEWQFRRFVDSLATKKQTAEEVSEHIEWTLNEYREGMKRRHIKIVQSSFAALIVPAVDLTFNTSGNHMAALVAAGLAINKLRVELLEGEMKAPGRECAYVFEAQKRFGQL
jgi:hypothetical protein